MIQRLQSIYFLIGAGLLSMALWFTGGVGPAVTQSTASPMEMAIAIAVALGCLIALGLIFMYKNRKRQLKLAIIPSLMAAIVLVLQLVGLVEVGLEAVEANSWILIGSVAISILFFVLARRGIKNDIDLVKSMDRIR